MAELLSYALRRQETTSRLNLPEGMSSFYTLHMFQEEERETFESDLEDCLKEYFSNADYSKSNRSSISRDEKNTVYTVFEKLGSENLEGNEVDGDDMCRTLEIMVTHQSVATRFDLPTREEEEHLLNTNGLYHKLGLYGKKMSDIASTSDEVMF